MLNVFENKFANALVSVVICILLAFGAFSFYKTVSSDGRITHCYVDAHAGGLPVYKIVGFRNWRSDVTIGIATTPEQANESLKTLCP